MKWCEIASLFQYDVEVVNNVVDKIYYDDELRDELEKMFRKEIDINDEEVDMLFNMNSDYFYSKYLDDLNLWIWNYVNERV